MGEVSAAGRARAAAGGAVRLSTLLYYHSADEASSGSWDQIPKDCKVLQLQN